MQEDLIAQTLTNLVQLVIIFVGGLLVRYLKSNYTSTQLKRAMAIADTVVRAVEMIAVAYGFSPQEKMKKAVEMAKVFAQNHGLKLTDEQWQTMIEAAVHQMKVLGEELKKDNGKQ
jgi:hypothetical protein